MSLDFYQNINNFIIYIRNNRKDENIYNIMSNHLDDLMRTNTKEQNILIIKYYSGSINEAINKQHLHINFLLPYVEKHINTKFIFIHFSTRYNKNKIKEYSNKYIHLNNLIFWI